MFILRKLLPGSPYCAPFERNSPDLLRISSANFFESDVKAEQSSHSR